MTDAVIVMAKRTPIGRIGGALSSLEPEALLAPLIRHILAETNVPHHMIDDVVIGNVVGPGGNIGRVAALEAGLPVTVPGVTIDRQCGSGLEAINMAARLIQSGAGEIYLAGGVESTSRAPWRMFKPKTLTGTPELYTRARFTPSAYGDPDMGVAAENVAHAYGISRAAQDRYALDSHEKAVRSRQTGRFQQEIIPLEVQGCLVDTDECPRADTSLEKLQRLKPVFADNGTVTAGNACPMNDGAALVLMMSRDKCRELNLRPVLRIVDARVAGVDPHVLGIGPVPAIRSLLRRQQLTVDDLDVIEFNEAFASQVLASLQELQIPLHKVNPGGGALALGHPYGASGAILMTRLCAEMQRQPFRRGLAALGIGGGMGLATLVEAAE
ncbi:acetyl-CoA C-acyltransferase [Paenibacillus glucanolyticus]|uniref:thiolase family protein n=1 Tax=Paenibacillus TaxID=44249 RepID=UPI0003E23FFD|nr:MULTISPECIES: thiolase family protein [Paenibacillus]AVV58334.1 acetyl-CoA C-acyltransferase [Paenibacillus glucanolyticus]ETT42549.1 acetyl-CoA acetyltransferase [Paenibacillus sp. FSL R5-808]MCA4752284.1 thiolase family protein [Mycolicibacterium fortuitum]